MVSRLKKWAGKGVAVSTATFGPPLIVWLGPRRYTFAPGRDVTVGLDAARTSGSTVSARPAHPPLVVLHFNGNQWIAVDRSEAGIYVDGVRMSTVFIHDGRAITLGDPQHGPRLVFQLAAPPAAAPHPRECRRRCGPHAPPPPPAGPVPMPPPHPPPMRPPRHRRPRPVPHFQPPPAPPPPPRPVQWVAPPPPTATTATGSATTTAATAAAARPPPPQAAAGTAATLPAARAQADAIGARLTGAIQKLKARRPKPQPHEAVPTAQLQQPAEEQTAPPTPEPHATHRRSAGGASGAAQRRRRAGAGRSVVHRVAGHDHLGDRPFRSEHLRSGRRARRHEYNRASATVDFDGHDVAADDVRPHVGVVPRHDLLRPQLTVEQALRYAAELRLAAKHFR